MYQIVNRVDVLTNPEFSKLKLFRKKKKKKAFYLLEIATIKRQKIYLKKGCLVL